MPMVRANITLSGKHKDYVLSVMQAYLVEKDHVYQTIVYHDGSLGHDHFGEDVAQSARTDSILSHRMMVIRTMMMMVLL
jgi:hypothetical protein